MTVALLAIWGLEPPGRALSVVGTRDLSIQSSAFLLQRVKWLSVVLSNRGIGSIGAFLTGLATSQLVYPQVPIVALKPASFVQTASSKS